MSRNAKINGPAPGPVEMDRRKFLKCSALAGGLAASGALALHQAFSGDAQAAEGGAYIHANPENQLYSVCQQCNTNCGIKVKIVDGKAAKIDGNPYNPWTLNPHISYKTPLDKAATVEGALCPKGQAGIQTQYDPYRIVKVLKRAGKRGEGKWKSIPFDQAITEVVEGGDLFGEGKVEGLKDICTLRDPEASKALAEDADAVAKGKMPLDEFKAKHADNLKHLIDPEHPDMGPKNNQFVFNWGRLKGGRSDFVQRFCGALGTNNRHGHTTVCQGSLYFSCKAMSDQYTDGKWTGGSKFYWQADLLNSEFAIFVGANPYEANYGPTNRVPMMTDGIADGSFRFAVIDPRCSKTASRAWKWLPVKSSGVGAVAMAMIQWIIEHNRFDARYLANANKAAAKADNEPTWTQAAWLVKVGEDGKPGAYLRGSDLGLKKEIRKDKDDKDFEYDAFVVLSGGNPVAFDPNHEENAVEGDLLVEAEVKGMKVKSVLQVYKEVASAKTPEQWAEIAGLKASDIADLAREFTSHGKKAVADIHRGASQHTSGFYNVMAWFLVNILIGNHDHMGGLCKATTYDASGKKPGQPFEVGKAKAPKSFGIDIIRGGKAFDKTTLFDKFPAKRVWYPFCSDVYQEVIPSIGDAYPYPIKALMLYMGTPVYSLPAGHELISILSDTKKLPLFITSDIGVGETSMYSDYIFPDLTYLERWEFSGSHPSMPFKVFPVRQPVVEPLPEAVTVFGEKMPISIETLFLGIAEKMKLPGFGENAFGPGLHLKREEDLYLRMVANVAYGEKEEGADKVPAASKEELDLFAKSRRHLPATVFDLTRWKAVVGEELWPHVVTVLGRGGRFQDFEKGYKDGLLANKYGKMLGIYLENQLKTKNSMTGKPYLHYADYVPGPADCMGKMLEDEKQGFDLTLLTYKAVTQTKSRTSGNYWTLGPLPENAIEINTVDAQRLGLKTGDLVRVTSPSNPDGVWQLGPNTKKPMVGKVKVMEGIRPGHIAFALGFGHWANGSGAQTVDGVTIPGDKRRAGGVHANAAMRVDPVLKNTGLVDPVGGSAVFYQSQVKLVKI
ncbi:MAG: molybdopterin-dependent oxidoreductase [Humidesulfovibrio sp.]|uniref:molybdopterin dinucleotide binding domain-containing protein n=1 Tax=Humidesulfovibrio sp. TaxID=2910988 RepID=UPI002733120B|nr:molybdopterin dinucleotide binding domain-containing protein [Humidesulfovibrio sp.]MDP2847518.1 molybdopterin-dependent oxidoreductase [Humidesulfovibrio sp.]